MILAIDSKDMFWRRQPQVLMLNFCYNSSLAWKCSGTKGENYGFEMWARETGGGNWYKEDVIQIQTHKQINT